MSREYWKRPPPSDRAQVKNECRTTLDAIKESYEDTRDLFRQTFKEFRNSAKILIKEAKGFEVTELQKQNALDKIKEMSFKKPSMQDEKNVNEIREEIIELRKQLKIELEKQT